MRPTRLRHRPLLALSSIAPILLILLAAGVVESAAQVVEGTLLDEETGQPIQGATVTLRRTSEGGGSGLARSALTSEAGAFRMTGVPTGRYTLSAERIGYAPVTSPPFDVLRGEVLTLELRASTTAVPLAPLTVTADRPALVLSPRLASRGFYERQERYGRDGMGFGRFLTSADPEIRTAFYATDIFRHIPGTTVVSSGRGYDARVLLRRGCIPTIFLDGTPIRTTSGISINELVSASDLAGVEIYVGLTAPIEFMDMAQGTFPCGSIVLWTGR